MNKTKVIIIVNYLQGTEQSWFYRVVKELNVNTNLKNQREAGRVESHEDNVVHDDRHTRKTA